MFPVTAIAGDVDIEGTGVVRLAQSSQLAATSNVTVNSNGNTIRGVVTAGFDLANNSQQIGTLAGTGTVALGSGSLTITAASTFAGTITDGSFGTGGNLILDLTDSTGIVALSGTNTYTGLTLITAGTLQPQSATAIPSAHSWPSIPMAPWISTAMTWLLAPSVMGCPVARAGRFYWEQTP